MSMCKSIKSSYKASFCAEIALAKTSVAKTSVLKMSVTIHQGHVF